jgi:hypothetical protein
VQASWPGGGGLDCLPAAVALKLHLPAPSNVPSGPKRPGVRPQAQQQCVRSVWTQQLPSGCELPGCQRCLYHSCSLLICLFNSWLRLFTDCACGRSQKYVSALTGSRESCTRHTYEAFAKAAGGNFHI